MAKKKKRSSWQDRRPSGDGPRLLDGEVPDGQPRGTGGVFHNMSPKLFLVFILLGLAVALLSQYAC